MYIPSTWIPSNPLKQDNNDIDRLPVVKIPQYEYEHLKRRSKRLEILERAFIECSREEVNDCQIGNWITSTATDFKTWHTEKTNQQD